MLGLLNIFISWHLQAEKFHNRLVLFAQAERNTVLSPLESKGGRKTLQKNLMCSTVEQIHTCHGEVSLCAYVYSNKFI